MAEFSLQKRHDLSLLKTSIHSSSVSTLWTVRHPLGHARFSQPPGNKLSNSRQGSNCEVCQQTIVDKMWRHFLAQCGKCWTRTLTRIRRFPVVWTIVCPVSSLIKPVGSSWYAIRCIWNQFINPNWPEVLVNQIVYKKTWTTQKEITNRHDICQKSVNALKWPNLQQKSVINATLMHQNNMYGINIRMDANCVNLRKS